MKKIVLFLILFAACLFVGCARTSEKEVFRFEAHQLDMKVGEEMELKLIYGSVSEKEEIVYYTSEEGIVELNGNVVTAVGNGVVKVTAQVKRIPTTKATVEITVSDDKLSGLKINGKDQMNINDTQKLTVDTNPSYITNDVEWTSSDPTIATVSATGEVKALKPGIVVINAKSLYDGTMVARKSIEVLYQGTERIELSFTSGNEDVVLATTSTLQATVYPEFANPNITWTSSNAAYATVKNGVITPVKVTPEGEKVIITAKSVDGVEEKIEIHVVYAAAESVSVTSTLEVVEVFEEKTITLKATVSPQNANQAVTWESSDPEIATVNEKGVVEGIKKGTVTITAIASDGTTKGELSVTVTGRPDPETIVTKLSNKEISEVTIEVECDETISVTISPADAKQDYTFTVSSETVASVEKNNRGLKITGLEVGDMVITITSEIDPTVKKEIIVHIIPLEE